MSNQLDLFHGVVLTTEQQEQIDNFIKGQANRAVKCQEDINRTMLLLDEAGFVQGVDYDSNFEQILLHQFNSSPYFSSVCFSF